MKNVLLISADFPMTYYQFAKAFKHNGCRVLVIGSTPYNELHPELIANVDEYYQTWEMENINKMFEIVGYFENKYGHIDFLESNNEYWLQSDAKIRERFNITSGLFPAELETYQRKSSMKKAFIAAGGHVAPFIIVRDFDSLKAFADQYGYPVFAKPDIGVGAAGNYKINNEEELRKFHAKKPYIDYICEPFVQGRVISFDGIANEKSEPVICANEIFPPAIFDFHNNDVDMFYYVNKKVPESLLELGKNIIKCLGLKNRFFHTELFIAENSVKGHFKKGDIVPLEVNIRTPGGFTPDLLNFGLSTNLYQMFADVVCFGKSDENVGPHYYAACAARKYKNSYFYSHEDILRTFAKDIVNHGEYPLVFSDLMGNYFYMAKFDKIEDVDIFRDYVSRKRNSSLAGHDSKISHVVGEDRKMMREKNSKSVSDDGLSICDKHIDGA